MMRLNIVFLVIVVLLMGGYSHAETVPTSRAAITMTFAPLVKQVTPAVVNIYTKKLVTQRVSPLFGDPFFRQFFEGVLPPGLNRQRLENSLGSGVIIRGDGLVVTSNHVIADADQIRVVLSDRRELDAKIVTVDEHSDLAVLRIDAKGEKLPFLELKDSDEAEVGDLVLAIGNPFGVGQTVTSGIISAMAHTSVASSDLDYFIQTDAAINPGNSGGALVTMDGKLVGINAAIYSQSGGNLGIGFAVPSNMVKVVLNAVDEGKKTLARAWLGFDGQAITPEIAASLSLPQPSGVLIKSLHPKSPAYTGGLQKGDVIYAINGKTVEDPEAFHYRIATLPLGSDATFGVIRKQQKLEFHVKLSPPPEDPPRDKRNISGQNPFAGATYENLSPAVLDELGLHGPDHGVIVALIAEDSIAAQVGLEQGDIIRSVDNKDINSVADLESYVYHKNDPNNRWQIRIERGGGLVSIMVGG